MRRLRLIVPLAALALLAVVALVLGRGKGGGAGAPGAPDADGPMTVVSARLRAGMEGGFTVLVRFRTPDVPADHRDSPDAPSLHIKTACRVGDRVLAANGLWDPDLRDRTLPDGVDEDLAFVMGDPLPARPDRCEVAIRLYKGLTPTNEVHRSCLDGGETVTDGPCVPPVVEHPPPGKDPIVSDVTATIDQYGLVIGYRVTGAGPPDPDRNVDFDGQCETTGGGRTGTISSGCSPVQSPGELEPGESVHCDQIGMQAAPGEIARCELRFRTSVRATPSPDVLATFCADVGGGPARPGPCP
jgi:hypothetical protein